MVGSQGEERNMGIHAGDAHNPDNQGIALDNHGESYEKHSKEKFEGVIRYVKEGEYQLKLGMIVHSENEAYEFYNEYALSKGFSIRRDKKRYKHGTNELCERTYVCSKQGFRDSSRFELKKVDRLETRTGCKAFVTFKVDNGLWELIHFSDDHAHDFVLPEQRHLLRSGRKMSLITKDVVDSLHSAGVGPTKAHDFIAKEVGGFQNVVGTKRDFQNFVNKKRMNLFEAGDAQALINHFKHKQAVDPMFFYSVQLDDENRLTNVFWRDGISKLDYECFGDVVVFDTTFRTNKYNMACAPFVGVNHHWQNVLFGCAFLLDESTCYFVWLFECFLQAMGNKMPETIFTDQDHAMASAIKQVFPNVSHRLCEWHLYKNAAQNISHLYRRLEFKKKFFKCFRGCQTEEEFEYTWKEMIEEAGAVDNSWLCKLYDIRKKWCPVFSNDFFSANMKATQRSESTNNVFHLMSCKTLTLTEFVNHYEENAEKMRATENDEDFRCIYGKPRVSIPSGILMHAADVYTCKMFSMFQEEFMKGVAEKVIEHVYDGVADCYKLKKENSPKVHTVLFDSSNFSISCSCKKFETLGLFCCHILRILNVSNNDNKIPAKYIVKRWTKGAKEIDIGARCSSSLKSNVKESKTVTFSRLMHKTSKIMNLASFDRRAIEIFEEHIDEAYERIKTYKQNLDPTDNVDPDFAKSNQISTSVGKKVVFSPPKVRPKGVTNARIKSSIEKRGRKKTKTTMCSQKKTSNHGIFDAGSFDLNLGLGL